MLMQGVESCDTREDLDVDGVSTDSDETQVSDELLNLQSASRKQVTETTWNRVAKGKKSDNCTLIQEKDRCDAGVEDVNGIPADSDERVEPCVSNPYYTETVH